MLFLENCFNFLEKCNICGKISGMSGKFFSYLGKNVVCPQNFFGMSGTFFEMTSPPLSRRQHFRGKIFRCPFLFEKCPSKRAPPQLVEASYTLKTKFEINYMHYKKYYCFRSKSKTATPMHLLIDVDFYAGAYCN